MNRSKPEEIKRGYAAPRARMIIKTGATRSEETKSNY